MTSSIEFIDTALFSIPYELSYNDQSQKLLVRNHILALIHDFPSFVPSMDTYFDYDGTSMNLLNVSGFLHVSKFLPEVPLVIWLHQNYPIMAPMVLIQANPECRIHKNHPIIDNSGVVAPAYLNWNQRSTLCELVHNLLNLFLHDHPTMPSSILKVTALDDLVAKICDDVASMNTQNMHAIEKWSARQTELRHRADIVQETISSLVVERDNLEIWGEELRKYYGRLLNWLRSNKKSASMSFDEGMKFEDAFECIDEKSKIVQDCLAGDRAAEDVMYALDKALVEGVINFDDYMKQVRILAREQFLHKAMLVKLKVPLS